MRQATRVTGLVTTALLVGTPDLWAHPGHVFEGGLWTTLEHVLASPYHLAVVVAGVVLVVGWTLAALPTRSRSGVEKEPNA